MFKFDLLLFDFDGTLCSTHEAISYCIKKTFEERLGVSPSESTIKETISKGITLEDTFKQLFIQVDKKESDDIAVWLKIYRDLYEKEGQERTFFFDGTTELFHHVFETKTPIVIISNKGEMAVKNALKRSKLLDYVTLIIGDSPGFLKKPNPMIFTDIVQPKFKSIPLEKILFIGDTSADILFAKNCKVKSCWAKYGYGDQTQCIGLNPDYTIDNLSDLKSFFQKQEPQSNLTCKQEN